MTALHSLIYLSDGNLPSQWAHSIQIAKMSQAYASQIDRFELITSGSLVSPFKRLDEAFKRWYGLRRDFKVVRIPAHLRTREVFPIQYYSARYYQLALLYSYLKAPTLIKTRTYHPAVMELLWRAGLPVLWEYHELIKQESYHCKFFNYPNLIGVVTLSSYQAESFVRYGLPPDKLFVAPSGVDLDNFLPYQSRAEARQYLSLDPTARLIVYSGHLYDYKGIPTILEVAKLMPDCQFILVGGWAEDIAKVQKMVQAQAISNLQIKGHVPQSQIASYLYAADVLLLPTSRSWKLSEVTSPLKLFEYMAVKRPIVSSALPNVMTVLRDQENGLLVEPDQPIAFQQAITQLLEQPDFAQAIADQAYQTVQDFTWEKRATRILDFATQQLATLPKQPSLNIARFIRALQTSLR